EAVELTGLQGGAEPEHPFRTALGPVAHACLFTALTNQRLAGALHLAAADLQSQLTIPRIVDALPVVLQVPDELPQRFTLAWRTERLVQGSQRAKRLADATMPQFIQALSAELFRRVILFAIQGRRRLMDVLAQVMPVEDLHGIGELHGGNIPQPPRAVRN